nr:hypothetical protein Itr_chr04CG16670 [Ipomoea trifida]GMC86651.1 hypothetical protein Iba_chr04dCG12840 [Ipomoea batatas]
MVAYVIQNPFFISVSPFRVPLRISLIMPVAAHREPHFAPIFPPSTSGQLREAQRSAATLTAAQPPILFHSSSLSADHRTAVIGDLTCFGETEHGGVMRWKLRRYPLFPASRAAAAVESSSRHLLLSASPKATADRRVAAAWLDSPLLGGGILPSPARRGAAFAKSWAWSRRGQ